MKENQPSSTLPVEELHDEKWNGPFTRTLPSPRPDSSDLPERLKAAYPPEQFKKRLKHHKKFERHLALGAKSW